MVSKTIVRRFVSQKSSQQKGKFMPLWYWRGKGCPEETLKEIEKSGKYEFHPQLGHTYQVDIHSTGEKNIEEMIAEHMERLLEKGKRGKSALKNGGEDEETKADASQSEGDAPQSDEDPSSDASDSSESRRRKRKHKKRAKKDKKDQREKKRSKKHKKKQSSSSSSEGNRKKGKKSRNDATDDGSDESEDDKNRQRELLKLERRRQAAELAEKKKQEREKKKRDEMARMNAGKALAKLTPLHLKFEVDLANPLFKQIPKVMRTKADDSAKAIKLMKTEAELCLSSLDPAPLTFTLKDTNELHKTSCEVLNDLATMFKGMRRCA